MSSPLVPGKAVRIGYTNAKGESSERWIVPTFVPLQNIKALDVSDLSEENRELMEQLVQEHLKYRDEHAKLALDFAEWVKQETGTAIEPKYRTFKIDSIKVDDC
jgi:hypothetical protein